MTPDIPQEPSPLPLSKNPLGNPPKEIFLFTPMTDAKQTPLDPEESQTCMDCWRKNACSLHFVTILQVATKCKLHAFPQQSMHVGDASGSMGFASGIGVNKEQFWTKYCSFSPVTVYYSAWFFILNLTRLWTNKDELHQTKHK